MEHINNFINEIIKVCEKFNKSIAHEDAQGAFIIEDFKMENIDWFRNAINKSNKQKETNMTTTTNSETSRKENIIKRLDNADRRSENLSIRSENAKVRFSKLNPSESGLTQYEELCSMIEFCCSATEQAHTLLENGLTASELHKKMLE